jgi:ferredoxin
MKIHVDPELCDLHGQCVITAPEIFQFDDDCDDPTFTRTGGGLSYRAEVGDDLADRARAAASVCPTAAIELQG